VSNTGTILEMTSDSAGTWSRNRPLLVWFGYQQRCSDLAHDPAPSASVLRRFS